MHGLTEGVGHVDGEGEEEDVGARVGQDPESVVGLLSGGVPQVEADGLAVVDDDLHRVVVAHRRNVHRRVGNPNIRNRWLEMNV